MGRIKSTVLYYKNGTLTEERFKNLTPLQWLFHYYEIAQHRNNEEKLFVNLTELILDRLETLWYTTNPEIGSQLIERVNKGTISKDKDKDMSRDIDGITPENFLEKWNELITKIPPVLEIPDTVDKKKKNKFLYPTFSRDQLRKKVIGLEVKDPGSI